jgi:YD repeat-containing protein
MPSKDSFNRASHKIFGNVKRVVSRTFYTDKFGRVLRDRCQTAYREFSADDKILVSRYTELNGLDSSHYRYSYGNQTVEQKFVNSDGSFGMAFSFKLDEKNRVIEKTVTISGAAASRETTIYDDELNRESYVKYGPSGKIEKRIITQYDQNGRMTEMYLTENERDKTIFKSTYLDGGIRITKMTDEKQNVKKFTIETRDMHGNLTQYSESGAGGSDLFKVLYENSYDSVGELTQIRCTDADGKLNWRRTFAYDNFGNIVSETTYAQDRKIADIETLDKITESSYEYFEEV